MKFLRARRQWSGWLALTAMLLQLALSFGHLHAEDIAHPIPTAVPTAAADHSAPAGGDDREHADCAVCITLHLAADSLLPPAVQAPAALLPTPISFANAQNMPPRPATGGAFRARAPPQG